MVPAAKLAEFHAVPPSYLAKHLQALSQSGIVESLPGPRGGYRLARPADQVTVLDVVLAVEGDEKAFVCTEIRQRGPAACDASSYKRTCGIARVMWAAETAWRKALAEHTIADLVAGTLRDSPRAGQRRASQWIKEAVR